MSDPQLSPETIAISAGRPPVTKDGSLNPDISLSSTYHADRHLHLHPAMQQSVQSLHCFQLVRQLLHPIRDTAEQWRCLLHFKRAVA